MRRIKTVIRSDYFILFLIAFFYVIIVSSVAISRHYAFRTNAWDLSIYSQSLYSTLNHGKLLYYTSELPGNPSGSLFGIHFSPFLFLLVPIYAIYQNPVTLLILRPIAISIGLIPLYWILREQQLNSRLLTFFLAIIYVVYPPINAPLSNFDVEAFLPALFLFAIYYNSTAMDIRQPASLGMSLGMAYTITIMSSFTTNITFHKTLSNFPSCLV